jgi:uncharacterized repeat protein (TIGR02543 family)
VIADSTISATFAINTFTITASAGSYGTISPSGSVTVDTGANQAFSITPDANYHVDTVKVNGLPIGAVPSYTFYSVGADSSISASFAINPYSVTYDGNGNDLGTNPPVDSNLYVSGQTATVLGQASLLKSGFAFDGWNTQSDSLGTNVSPGSGLTITGSVTLFAKWK